MKEGLMEKKPIKTETKANRQREEGWQLGEELRRRQGEGVDCAGRGGLAGRFIKKRAGRRAAERQGKPGPSRSLSITLQSSRGPLGQTLQVTCQGKKKKIHLDTRARVALWGSNGGQFVLG